MRKRKRSAPPTDNRRRSEAGSIALEASLVLPIVLMVLLFFIALVRLNAAQMALHGAVSQTTRLAAANMHPIELAVAKASDASSDDGQSETGGDRIGAGGTAVPAGSTLSASGSSLAVGFIADKLEEWLPAPSGPLLAAVLKGDWDSLQDTAMGAVGRPIVEPLLRREADESVLDPGKIRLTSLSLPDLKHKEDVMLTIEAEYAFRLGLPFTKRSIVLKERATERVWTSDTVPSQRANDAGEELAAIQIVLVEPSPARPGNKARVVVKTTPGRSLSIEVLYKSGRSVAKHLGDVVTDEAGLAEWTWLVSGNTTPGTWEIAVRASDGATAVRHFIVKKKQAGE